MDSTVRCVPLYNGNAMPIIGLGMWQTDNEELVRVAVKAAIDSGYRHIDTAFAYKNETFLGKVLQEILCEAKIKREDIFIVSKLPPNGMRPNNVEYFFKKSLSALQLEYLDLYLVHSPIASQRSEDDEEFMVIKDGDYAYDKTVDLVETWKAMEKLVDKGLVRSIGISNFNSKQIQRIYDSARIKPAVLQVECHAYLPQYELHEFCQNRNIAFTAYSPLGSPGLAEFAKKKYKVDYKQEQLLEDSRLKPLATKHKKTPAQILLRYLVQRGIIVIPKSSNPSRIKENIQIFDFSLDEEDLNVLKSMNRNLRYFTFDFYKSMKESAEYPFGIPF